MHGLSFGRRLHRRRAGHEPELLVLDEVVAGLDQRMRSELLAVLDGLHAQGITLLLATHGIDFAFPAGRSASTSSTLARARRSRCRSGARR